MKPTVCHTNS